MQAQMDHLGLHCILNLHWPRISLQWRRPALHTTLLGTGSACHRVKAS
jgi:hypothetical protein